MTLNINKEIVEQIKTLGLKEKPLEACGYLAGTGDVVSKFFPMTNIDKSPEHFSLDPKEQFSVIKTIRQDKLSLLAVVHTHPSSSARPSDEDIRLAYDPNIIYVICSLQEPPAIKAFWIKQGVVTPEKINIS